MSNIKSWADHCSSDEESDEDRIAPPPSGLPGSTSYSQLHQEKKEEEQGEDGGEGGSEPPPLSRTSFALSAFPDRPPYTAYLGNLPYNLCDSNELGRELQALLRNRTGGDEIRIRDVRLTMKDGRSKGFGYVEFDTSNELLTFLHLENPQVGGRFIKVDLAESLPRSGGGGRRRSEARGSRGGRDRDDRGGGDTDVGGHGGMIRDSGVGGGSGRGMRGSMGGAGASAGMPPIDGSQFMGGRYAQGSSSGNLGSSGGASATLVKCSDNSTSFGSIGGGPGGGDGAPRQRPSLKLLARTKPLKDMVSSSQSSIFGGAKPRDETKFSERKASRNEATAPVTSLVEKLQIKGSDIKPKPSAIDYTEANATTAPKALLERPSDNDAGDQCQKGSAPPNETPKNVETSFNNATTQNAETPRVDIASGKAKPADPRKQNFDRRDSSRSGHGGGRGKGSGKRENSGKDNSCGGESGKKQGRRESTRKSGRGGGARSGGRRETSDRRNSERRQSKANKNGNNSGSAGNHVGKTVGSSSAVAAVQSTPAPSSKEKKKANRPKKANSFAAFMDDSD